MPKPFLKKMCPHDRRRREPCLLSEANPKALALAKKSVFYIDFYEINYFYHLQIPKKRSSLRGGTMKQSIMLVILAIKIASSAKKAFSQ